MIGIGVPGSAFRNPLARPAICLRSGARGRRSRAPMTGRRSLRQRKRSSLVSTQHGRLFGGQSFPNSLVKSSGWGTRISNLDWRSQSSPSAIDFTAVFSRPKKSGCSDINGVLSFSRPVSSGLVALSDQPPLKPIRCHLRGEGAAEKVTIATGNEATLEEAVGAAERAYTSWHRSERQHERGALLGRHKKAPPKRRGP